MYDLTIGGLRQRVMKASEAHRSDAQVHREVEVVKAYALIQIMQELNEIKNILADKA